MIEKSRYYLLHGLAGAPDVIAHLLAQAQESVIDLRPDPARFTLREVVGHLADWEGVWYERLQAFLTKDCPHLQGYDEGQWAIDHDYEHMDIQEQLSRFRKGRNRLVAALREMTPEQWERHAIHSEWGEAQVSDMVALIAGHDGYHMHQVVEWLQADN